MCLVTLLGTDCKILQVHAEAARQGFYLGLIEHNLITGSKFPTRTTGRLFR